ncbi:MAG: hypothetical protein Ct9H90mP16_05710 [Candidatus Poseidoniales archaeon]|nr:MAG: hypothetical protein Ct9H90mP16_05710 [Candidatus Poseidoniales archaeon]
MATRCPRSGPTAGSMLLAGVMLKMGAYGFLRLGVTLFPEQVIEFQTLLLVLGMISLVYGAVVCLGQLNLKRMVAYSSVSHMGLIFLGIATLEPLGIAGAIFMMFAHGIISPLLFAVCGSFKHHYHTLEIDSMRGLAKHSPWMSGHMMVGWMGSLGLPLMAGFVAEVAVLIAFYMAFGWWVLFPASPSSSLQHTTCGACSEPSSRVAETIMTTPSPSCHRLCMANLHVTLHGMRIQVC